MQLTRTLSIPALTPIVGTYILWRFYPQWVTSAIPGLLSTVISIACIVHVFWNICIYRNFLDPLRSLPTIRGHFNFIRIICESPRGQSPLKWMHDYPDTPFIRFREFGVRDYLLVANEAALHEVLVTQPNNFQKPWEIRTAIASMVGGGLVTHEGTEHRKLRLAIGSGFNIHSVRPFYPVIWKATRIFLDSLQICSPGRNHEVGIDVSTAFRPLFINIIGLRLVGDHWLKDPTGIEKVGTAFRKILDPSFSNIVTFALHIACPSFIARLIPQRRKSQINVAKGELRDLFSRLVHQRQQQVDGALYDKTSKLGLIDLMTRKHTYGLHETAEQIMQDFTSFELLSFVFSWCCYELSKHPSFQDSLRHKIHNYIHSASAEPSWTILESIPLLNAFCREVLRLHPIAPITPRKSIRDTVIAGVRIPKGTRLLLSPYGMGQNRHLWGPRAHEFCPERWIDKDQDGNLTLNNSGGASARAAYHPFLFGRRECLGKELVYAQLRCVIAAVVGRYSMSLPGPTRENRIGGMITIGLLDGVYIRFCPVQESG